MVSWGLALDRVRSRTARGVKHSWPVFCVSVVARDSEGWALPVEYASWCAGCREQARGDETCPSCAGRTSRGGCQRRARTATTPCCRCRADESRIRKKQRVLAIRVTVRVTQDIFARERVKNDCKFQVCIQPAHISKDATDANQGPISVCQRRHSTQTACLHSNVQARKRGPARRFSGPDDWACNRESIRVLDNTPAVNPVVTIRMK